MKIFTRTLMTTLLLGMSIAIFGCASPMIVTGSSVHGAPNGCVEFYYDSWKTLSYRPAICRTDGSLIATCGCYYQRPLFGSKMGLTIWMAPGTETFVVKMKNVSERVNVEVKEGMVTPVRITATVSDYHSWTTYNYQGSTLHTKTYYDMEVEVEPMKPLKRKQ